jgi:hypothetical protein
MASSEVTSLFGARAVKLSTIGRVIELLTSEFPDLTPSKIRFLEEQGLVIRTELNPVTESSVTLISKE